MKWTEEEIERVARLAREVEHDEVRLSAETLRAIMTHAVELVAAREPSGFGDFTALKARVAILESELAEARATIARLTAAGQVLSEHADKAGEPIPDPCICGAVHHHAFGCPAGETP